MAQCGANPPARRSGECWPLDRPTTDRGAACRGRRARLFRCRAGSPRALASGISLLDRRGEFPPSATAGLPRRHSVCSRQVGSFRPPDAPRTPRTREKTVRESDRSRPLKHSAPRGRRNILRHAARTFACEVSIEPAPTTFAAATLWLPLASGAATNLAPAAIEPRGRGLSIPRACRQLAPTRAGLHSGGRLAAGRITRTALVARRP